MGTRHLIAVVLDGKYKVAQYGQWDGNPGGQGLTILRFLRDEMTEQFLTNLCGCRFGSKAEIDAAWAKGDTQALSRDTGGEILSLIQEAPRMLHNSLEFVGDSLFCEWAYVVDLDDMVLEVYKGFNKTPLEPGARFEPFFKREERRGDDQYYPVKIVADFLLAGLPTDGAFVAACDPPELEEPVEAAAPPVVVLPDGARDLDLD